MKNLTDQGARRSAHVDARKAGRIRRTVFPCLCVRSGPNPDPGQIHVIV